MSLIVMKFGGTSVGTAECMKRAGELVSAASREHDVVVVVSAMGGVTDQIIGALNAARAGASAEAAEICEGLRKRHRAAVDELFREGDAEAVHAAVGAVLERLADICAGVAKVSALPPQISDMALSLGEEMSARIIAAHLAQRGTAAEYVDSAECVITDAKFGEATPDMEATTRSASARLQPVIEQGRVPVVTGYRGATAAGQWTTLGRGGSDYSATLLGAALRADEVWIWTDVDGVLGADPRLCPRASTLDEITFNEAVELSHYGAKVIHQRAIQPARDAAIPVWIKNSFRPEVAGTRIARTTTASGSPVKAVTAVPKASLITVSVRHDVHPAEIYGRLLMRLAAEHVDLLFSTQSSPHNLLFAVREQDDKHVLEVIRRLFRTELEHGVVEAPDVQRSVAVIAVLGEAMKGTPGILARLFTLVAERNISVIAVSQGASELNICFAVPSAAANELVQAVHDDLCAGNRCGALGAAAPSNRAQEVWS